MKTLCIMNLKGGVAKTITAINMAAILAGKYGKRVLLIDADLQANTSKFFRADRGGDTLREILLGEIGHFWPDAVQHTGYEGLDIIPANLFLAELDLSDREDRTAPVYRLREFLLCVAEDDAYDYAVVDMPPGFSMAAQAALVAADEVVIPIKLDAFSVDGMVELTDQIALMRRINPRLRLSGVLITMWYADPVMGKAEMVLRSGAVPVYQTTIRRSDPVNDNTFSGEPLYIYSPRCGACVDYRRFVAEYLEGGPGNA